MPVAIKFLVAMATTLFMLAMKFLSQKLLGKNIQIPFMANSEMII